MKIILNLNHQVKLKLRPEGVTVFRNHFCRLRLDPDVYYKPCPEGYIRMPLWEMMSIFGHEMRMGMTQLIEKNEIIFEEHNI